MVQKGLDQECQVAAPNRTLVWDLPTRVFHWLLVGAVTLTLGGALFGPESALDLHAAGGYTIGLLVVFRLIWGFVGGHYSRFHNFPLSPKHLHHHLRHLRQDRPNIPLGHNPAGSWMIFLILFLLAILTASGLVVLGGQENIGPLAAWIDFRTGQGAAALHSSLSWILIGAIVLHVSAVVAGSIILKLPLISAMIRGSVPIAPSQGTQGNLLIGRGLFVFSIVALVFFAPSAAMTNLPPSGWHAIPVNTAYQESCSECHHAHHPSLRSADDWHKIMASLSNHFGENAILDTTTAEEIEAFLTANSTKTFDTEAANLIGHVSVPSLRMTDTIAWKERHASLPEGIFKNRDVGSAVNCNACHKDASQGRFDDQAISLPKGTKK